MPADTSAYSKMLDRAWRAAYDAAVVAEGQLRHQHAKRLFRVCNMVNECQADVNATADALARDQLRLSLPPLAGRTSVRPGRPLDD